MLTTAPGAQPPASQTFDPAAAGRPWLRVRPYDRSLRRMLMWNLQLSIWFELEKLYYSILSE